MTSEYTPPAPPPPPPTGCILELRDGSMVQVNELSITGAKHIRRSDGIITVSMEKGGQRRISGKQIKKILPALSPNPS